MPPPPDPAPRPLDPLAAVLSYLVPGLGQVVQGRIAKGVLFFVCLYGLFFYGMGMGQMRNVWLGDAAELPPAALPVLGDLSGVPKALYYRPQFLGQFWIGAAAWPALVQYAKAGPAKEDGGRPDPVPPLGHYMQAPPEVETNALLRNGTKRFELGWVYTVIAGVLNILVIYDALAGPVVRDDDEKTPAPPAPAGSAPPPPPAGGPSA